MSNPARKPCLNEAVHYVSHGSPDGTYQSECKAADITRVTSQTVVNLMVKNDTGLFFNQGLPYFAYEKGNLKAATWHFDHG